MAASRPLQLALEMSSTVVSGVDAEMVASSDDEEPPTPAPVLLPLLPLPLPLPLPLALLPLLPLPLLRLCSDADLTSCPSLGLA